MKYTIEQVKNWRKDAYDAGRPSSLRDFYRAHKGGDTMTTSTYCIAVLRHAYHPDIQGDERPRIHITDTGRNDRPIEYDSVDEAVAVIQEWKEQRYILDHGESGRPTYLVVPAVDGDYVVSGRREDASNYDWENLDCVCGECATCVREMIVQDRDYLISCAVASV